MKRLRAKLGRRPNDERGASLVEFALILPIFVLLLFGLIDFGLVFGGTIALRSELNAGARAVSVNEVASSCSKSSTPLNCTVLTYIGTLPGTVPNTVDVALVYASSNPAVGDPVAVCAQAQMQSTTGMLGPLLNQRWIKVKSELRLEQAPSQTGQSTYYTYNNKNPNDPGFGSWCST